MWPNVIRKSAICGFEYLTNDLNTIRCAASQQRSVEAIGPSMAFMVSKVGDENVASVILFLARSPPISRCLIFTASLRRKWRPHRPKMSRQDSSEMDRRPGPTCVVHTADVDVQRGWCYCAFSHVPNKSTPLSRSATPPRQSLNFPTWCHGALAREVAARSTKQARKHDNDMNLRTYFPKIR